MLSNSVFGGDTVTFTLGPVKLPETSGKLQLEFGMYSYLQGKNTSELFEVDTGKAAPYFEMTPGDFVSA